MSCWLTAGVSSSLIRDLEASEAQPPEDVGHHCPAGSHAESHDLTLSSERSEGGKGRHVKRFKSRKQTREQMGNTGERKKRGGDDKK